MSSALDFRASACIGETHPVETFGVVMVPFFVIPFSLTRLAGCLEEPAA